jgi:MOSC domain-containing protein YiiM
MATPAERAGEGPPLRGRLASINVSGGGVPKLPSAATEIRASGLEGDRQRDLRHHGGPDRAVSLFSLEVIQALAEEGHPVGIGTTGENLTVSGLDWRAVVPGAEIEVGPALLRVTAYASPCSNVEGSFRRGAVVRISQKLHPGWSRVYARVLRGGMVRVGDPVELRSAPPPDPSGS